MKTYFPQWKEQLPQKYFAVLQPLLPIAAAENLNMWLVGGLVRDLLLQRPLHDFDLLIEGNAIAFARKVQKKLGGKIATHSPFLTATWVHPGELSLDLITARKECYPQPAVLPVIEPAGLSEDLARRDFTINTLAIGISGQDQDYLIDLHQAKADLQQRKIRVLHDRSFEDDPTRIFRAVRFEQRFGFKIEEHTLALLHAQKSSIHLLTPVRVRHEFEMSFREESAAQALQRLLDLGVLSEVHPALSWNNNLTEALKRLPGSENRQLAISSDFSLQYGVWLGSLEPGQTSGIIDRLALPGTVQSIVKSVQNILTLNPAETLHLPHLRWRRFNKTEPAVFYILLALYPETALADYIHIYLDKEREKDLIVNGQDLIALGLQPGPAFQTILEQVNNAWLDGEITTREQAVAKLATEARKN